MNSIYGGMPDQTVSSNLDDVIAQVFKLLPYKEENSEFLDNHFSFTLLRMSGLIKLFPQYPEFITVLTLLEAARSEEDFALYRKAVLDSCAILKKMQGCIANGQSV